MSATWEIRQGDALERLREMPAESVHCCVTSPPYWNLRDYGIEGQIGLEGSPDEYVAALVAVFREVRRVLRSDGTLWLVLGDTYAGSWGAQSRGATSQLADRSISAAQILAHPKRTKTGAIPAGATYKRKDLLLLPAQVALALRADGWWVRAENIWAKRSAMPDPTQDRTTRSHEQVFTLSKSDCYFYDADAIAEEAISDKPSGNGYKRAERLSLGGRGQPHPWFDVGGKRNKRSVWWLSSEPFRPRKFGLDVDHYATFPSKLVEPCILAGSPERACEECGAPWQAEDGPRVGLDLSRPQARRAVELATERGLTDDHIAAIRACGVSDTGRAHATQNGSGQSDPDIQVLADEAKAALGGYYREFLLVKPTRGDLVPTCEHEPRWAASVVLDPFAGAGTTGLVALRHGRSFVGVELSPAYAEMARERIRQDAPLLNTPAEVTTTTA